MDLLVSLNFFIYSALVTFKQNQVTTDLLFSTSFRLGHFFSREQVLMEVEWDYYSISEKYRPCTIISRVYQQRGIAVIINSVLSQPNFQIWSLNLKQKMKNVQYGKLCKADALRIR